MKKKIYKVNISTSVKNIPMIMLKLYLTKKDLVVEINIDVFVANLMQI